MDNAFDNSIIQFLNQYAQKSHFFDLAVYHFFWNNLVKGGVVAALFWWVWFQHGNSDFSIRAKLTSTLLFSVVAVAVARGLALQLPYRARPFHTASLHFKLTDGMAKETLENWSSFPSDHATLFFALSTGLLLCNRRIGILALAHTTLFICLPRLYLGVHFPTDLIAGAMIGFIMGWLACRPTIALRVSFPLAQWRERHSGSFYAAFFMLTYQIADLFEHVRGVLSALLKAVIRI